MRNWIRWIFSIPRFLWRTVSLIVLLSIVATIPILQFASFGYMLEVSARIARGQPVRSCFPGTMIAGRLFAILIFVFLSWLPVWFIADMAYTAELVQQGSDVARNWRRGARVISVVWVLWVLWALFRVRQVPTFSLARPCVGIKKRFSAQRLA